MTLVLAAGWAPGASAQAPPNEFVVTGGLSWETYDGNFSVVDVPTVDSTDHARAAVGEFGAFGLINLLARNGRYLKLELDGGLRQFAAMGFQLRDYAPREWVSSVATTYQQLFPSLGIMTLHAAYHGRAVEDRPPMPLFLQPGYQSYLASGLFQFDPIQSVSLDAHLDVETANYDAPRLLPVLDLLDRRSQGIEVGAHTVNDGNWNVRFFSGYRWTQYQRQSTQVDDDPFRRDKTVNLGALWAFESEAAVQRASLGIEGIVNRSNSRRPEYDALSVTGDVVMDLPWWGLSTGLTSLLTWKTYVHQTTFARLVPGEEADNASVVHLDFMRSVAPNLSGMLRFGWTRSETDIGASYYSRFSTSLLFNFRPAGQ